MPKAVSISPLTYDWIKIWIAGHPEVWASRNSLGLKNRSKKLSQLEDWLMAVSHQLEYPIQSQLLSGNSLFGTVKVRCRCKPSHFVFFLFFVQPGGREYSDIIVLFREGCPGSVNMPLFNDYAFAGEVAKVLKIHYHNLLTSTPF